MAPMAAMAAMAVMAAVISSTGTRDYGNQTIRRQDTFGTSSESRFVPVWVNIKSTLSEDMVSTASDEFGSPSASSDVFEVILRTGQQVASQVDRHTVWNLDSL